MWAQPEVAGESLSVVGSWDDWSGEVAMRRFDEAWWLADFGLPPGDHGYLVVEASTGRVDPYNPISTFRATDAKEVSLLQVADCEAPALAVVSSQELATGSVQVRVAFTPARDGSPIEKDRVRATVSGGRATAVVSEDTDGTFVEVEIAGLAQGKHRVDVEVTDTAGRTASVGAVAWSQRRVREPGERIVYQIMVDRFRGDAGTTLSAPATPGSRAGGTLDGVTATLESGYFDALGVTTLWLTPVYLGPDEAREGVDGQLYDGYHGYWPLDARAVDPRFGGDAALDALLQAAHARGVDVLLDIVPNHYYEANPRVAELAANNGLHEHEPACVCGTPACPWSDYIQNCWFTPYLPDLNHENPAVLDLVVDDAAWWSGRFDLDGFRVDAVPMMPRAVTRRIAHRVRREHGPRDASFHLGEIFTGPGRGGTEVIRYYLGPDGLDSAFDFPLMWAIRDVVAHDLGGFDAIEASLASTERAIEGSNSLMARIIGNHDVTRFASEAHGDAALDPWGATGPEQPTDEDVYRRQALALGLMFTLPGVPVVYYGDEVGLAGGADPDNRRVMPALEDLDAARTALLDHTRTLAVTRRCLGALRSGARRLVSVDADAYAFVRDRGDGAAALVLLSRATEPVAISMRADALPSTFAAGSYLDVLSGERFDLGAATADIGIDGLGMRLLIPADHVCTTILP